MENLNYDDLTEYATEVITEIRRRAYREGYGQGKFDAEMDSNEGNHGEDTTQNFELFTKIGDRLVELLQERRDEIIEKAKKDVEELKDDYDGLYTVDNGGHRFHPYACTTEYIVNKDKRTVVVLMRGRSTGRVRASGIAKAHPNDCFNVHIGKAIALRRALDLEVPDEYLNAPQPTEVREGDFVKTTRDWKHAIEGPFYKGDVFEVRSDHHGIKYACAPDSGITKYCEIIDDSREEDE